MADVLAAAHAAIADAGATPREKLLAQGVIAMMEDAEKLVALVEHDRDRLLTIVRLVLQEHMSEIHHARETSHMCALERTGDRVGERRRMRSCGACGESGHYRQKCPTVPYTPPSTKSRSVRAAEMYLRGGTTMRLAAETFGVSHQAVAQAAKTILQRRRVATRAREQS